MGGIAARLADQVIISTDNPRSENPQTIATEIWQGIAPHQQSYCRVILNRRKQLNTRSIQLAWRYYLIAGKGHEDYMEVNGVRSHFDDRETARQYLKANDLVKYETTAAKAVER